MSKPATSGAMYMGMSKKVSLPIPAVAKLQVIEPKSAAHAPDEPACAGSNVPWKRPSIRSSKKSLRRKERLCKKISNLENELDKARRNLERHLQTATEQTSSQPAIDVLEARRNIGRLPPALPVPNRRGDSPVIPLQKSLGHGSNFVGLESTAKKSGNPRSLSLRDLAAETLPEAVRETNLGISLCTASQVLDTLHQGGSSGYPRDVPGSARPPTDAIGSGQDHGRLRLVAGKPGAAVAPKPVSSLAIGRIGGSTGDEPRAAEAKATDHGKCAPAAALTTSDCENIPPVPRIPLGIVGKRTALQGRPMSTKETENRKPLPGENHWTGWDDDVF